MENKIRQVAAALSHFIDLLEPADEILVLTFNDRVELVQDFTSDRAQLARVLDVLEPSGGTALYDAAYAAIEAVAALPAESKAVVLVTDGVDTASATSFAMLREVARRAEVPVFSIGLDAGRGLPYSFALARTAGRRAGGGGRKRRLARRLARRRSRGRLAWHRWRLGWWRSWRWCGSGRRAVTRA